MSLKTVFDSMQEVIRAYRGLTKPAQELVRQAILEDEPARRAPRKPAGPALFAPILKVVREEPGLRRVDVAGRLERSPSSICRSVADLIEDGRLSDRAGGLYAGKKKKRKGRPTPPPPIEIESGRATIEQKILRALSPDPERAQDIDKLTKLIKGNKGSVTGQVYKMARKGLVHIPSPGTFCLPPTLGSPKSAGTNGHARVEA